MNEEVASPRPGASMHVANEFFWLAVALIGVLWLRRDVDQLNDLQISLGKSIAQTAALMVIPTYFMGTLFEAIFGSASRLFTWAGSRRGSGGLSRLLRSTGSPTLIDRVFDVAFIGIGVYTVGLLSAIDIFPGIMALVALFSQVLLSGMGRLPGGAMMLGCGGVIAALQMLLIGGVLLAAYSATPERNNLSFGAALALMGPALRMTAVSIMAIVGLFRGGPSAGAG